MRTKPPAAISFGLCQNFAELCEAFSLVYTTYHSQGYTEQSAGGMRFSLSDLLPLSTTIIAKKEGTIIGTSGVIGDGAHGLPSSEYFPDQYLNCSQGAQLNCEGTRLGVRDGSGQAVQSPALELIRWTISWAKVMGCDNYLIICNPKHTDWWQRLMGFSHIGTGVQCGHVCGNPGDLMRLSLKDLDSADSTAARRFAKINFLSLEGAHKFSHRYFPTDDELLLLLLATPEAVSHARIAERKLFAAHHRWVLDTFEQLSSDGTDIENAPELDVKMSANQFLNNLVTILQLSLRQLGIQLEFHTMLPLDCLLRGKARNNLLRISQDTIKMVHRMVMQHKLAPGTVQLTVNMRDDSTFAFDFTASELINQNLICSNLQNKIIFDKIGEKASAAFAPSASAILSTAEISSESAAYQIKN